MDSPEVGVESMPLEAAEKPILRWDSAASEDAREKMVFDSDRGEIDRYLLVVDEIRRSMSGVSISDEDDPRASYTIQIAMARLEDEFRNILITHTSPIEADSLSESIHSISESTHSFVESAAAEEHPVDLDLHGVSDDDQTESSARRSTNSISYRSTSSIREIGLVPPEAISDVLTYVDPISFDLAHVLC